MKSFIVSAICIALAFVGIGDIAEKVAAGLKSDEKALEIIRKARTAIGGDEAIAAVRGLVIKGQTSRTISIDGAERLEQGETEIAFEYPNHMMKLITIGDHDGGSGVGLAEKKVDVMIRRSGEPHKVIVEGEEGGFTTEDDKKIIVRKVENGNAEFKVEEDDHVMVRRAGDPAAGEGKRMRFEHKLDAEHAAGRDNEMLRTTLSLLLTAPEGLDVSYTFAGESSLDGTAVNAVEASFGGASFKLFFDRSSGLPVAMSYLGHPAPMIVKFRREAGEPAAGAKDTMVFTRKMEGPGELVENFVRFSDYRSTNGVQLPYKWTTTVGGKQTEVFDVTSYEVNPANLTERFKGEGVKVRMRKPASN